jgi:hypothetical protein
MDLCNGDLSGPDDGIGHETKEANAKRTRPRKRQHGPELEACNTKRRRADPQPPKTPKARGKQRTDIPSPSTSPEANPAPEQNDDHRHSRKRHNLVEQKYRSRLNSQFKQLLDTLPTSDDTTTKNSPSRSPGSGTRAGPGAFQAITITNTDRDRETHAVASTATINNNSWDKHIGNGEGNVRDKDDNKNAGDQRRLSKGEVLDRARMYIQSLEREHRRLVAERRELDFLWEEGYRRRCDIRGT